MQLISSARSMAFEPVPKVTHLASDLSSGVRDLKSVAKKKIGVAKIDPREGLDLSRAAAWRERRRRHFATGVCSMVWDGAWAAGLGLSARLRETCSLTAMQKLGVSSR
jgi:hypothetical protein